MDGLYLGDLKRRGLFQVRCFSQRQALYPPATYAQRYASQALPNCPLDNKLQHIYNVFMNSISFSWDDRKDIASQKKHRVLFKEAQTVFFDEHAIEYYDPDHSESEDRFLMLGHSYRIRILVVSYTLRKDGKEIRIISARKATKKEQKSYSGEIL